MRSTTPVGANSFARQAEGLRVRKCLGTAARSLANEFAPTTPDPRSVPEQKSPGLAARGFAGQLTFTGADSRCSPPGPWRRRARGAARSAARPGAGARAGPGWR
ncbi:hypothetical protein E8F12_13365 [Pseudomonas sp. BN102]|nr:hypothetical protein [Pseudomonas sp. BN102]